MRKIVPAILLSVLFSSLSAQDFSIRIRMNDEPMSLAYVLCNDRPLALSDEAGEVVILKSQMRYGDRLTASYIGATSSVVIYSAEVESAGSCTIELTPDFTLDEVVVKSEITGWDIFSKYTNIPILYEKRHDIKLDFSYTCSQPDETPRTVSGNILMNKDNSLMTRWDRDAYEKNLVIYTVDDTTGLKHQLLTDLFFTLQIANGAVYRIGQETFRDPDLPQFRAFDGRILFSFQHKGVENGERIFLVTNDAYEFGSSRPLRYLFRVSARNKHILSTESIHLLPQSLYNRRTQATYELYRSRWLKPKSAELESINPESGSSYYLTVDNIRYNTLSRREQKLLYPKEEYQNDRKEEKRANRAERQKNRRRKEYYRRFY